MQGFREVYLRLRNLRRRRLDRELDEEIRFHLQMSARDRIESGATADQARIEAEKGFGNVTALKERSRDMFRFIRLETLLQDLVYGVRALRRSPGFTIVALATLALGIGANTAIFSVVKAVLLNQLPYREPDRLVALGEADSGETHPETVGFTTAYDWRRLSHSFESMSLYRDARGAIVERGEPELLGGMRVNYDFFKTLGIAMRIGRDFLPEEDQPDTRHEVILSHSLWIRRFGGDPQVLGRSIRLSDAAFTIVGVLESDLTTLPIPGSSGVPEIFEPLGYALTDPFACRDCQHLHLIARLKQGVAADQGQAELNTIMADLVRLYPGSYPAEAKVAFEPLHHYLVGRVSTALWVLLGAVGLVLLIACANVANLMLVRANGRAKEIALRSALGAGRWRLIRQLLTESVLLAVLGGVTGIALARLCLYTLVGFAPSEVSRISKIGIDATVLWLALGVSLVTGVLFGLVPALRASRIDLNDALKNLGRVTGTRSRHGLTNFLVTAELTLAFVLVVGAGLLGQSFRRLVNVDPGFEPLNVFTLRTYVYGTRYQKPEAELSYYNRVLDQLRAIPGIASAAMTSAIPLADSDRYGFHIRDRHLQHESEAPSVDNYSVSPDYFRVMKIPLKRGRLFTAQDGANAPGVAMISETCAREEFPNEDPIGKQIQLGGRDEKRLWLTIIGVVGDVRQYGLETAPRIAAYSAQAQNLAFAYSLVARTSTDPRRLERAVRSAFLAVDPTQPVFQMQPLEAYLAGSLAQRSFTLVLLALFGALALVLATVGIYGVVSYGVALRTREVGIRMALGADRREVLAMVLRQGAALAGVGLLLGFAVSLGLPRLLSTLLFEAGGLDKVTTAAVAVLLGCVALAASYLPARRAASVDPMTALRNE